MPNEFGDVTGARPPRAQAPRRNGRCPRRARSDRRFAIRGSEVTWT